MDQPFPDLGRLSDAALTLLAGGAERSWFSGMLEIEISRRAAALVGQTQDSHFQVLIRSPELLFKDLEGFRLARNAAREFEYGIAIELENFLAQLCEHLEAILAESRAVFRPARATRP